MKFKDIVKTLINVDIHKFGHSDSKQVALDVMRQLNYGDIVKINSTDSEFFRYNFRGTTWKLTRELYAIRVILPEGTYIIDVLHSDKMIEISEFKEELSKINVNNTFTIEGEK